MSLSVLVIVLPNESLLGARWWPEEESHDKRDLAHHLVLD